MGVAQGLCWAGVSGGGSRARVQELGGPVRAGYELSRPLLSTGNTVGAGGVILDLLVAT